MSKICQGLAVVVLHEPQSREDIARGRGCGSDCPAAGVEIVPGDFLTGLDLGCNLASVLGRSCIHQAAVVGDRLAGDTRRSVGFAVPGLRILGVIAQSITGSRQGKRRIIGIVCIGRSRQPCDVNGTGSQSFAGNVVVRSGTDSDFNIADVISALGHLFLQQLRELGCALQNGFCVTGRNKLHLQNIDGTLGSGTVCCGCCRSGRRCGRRSAACQHCHCEQ